MGISQPTTSEGTSIRCIGVCRVERKSTAGRPTRGQRLDTEKSPLLMDFPCGATVPLKLAFMKAPQKKGQIALT